MEYYRLQQLETLTHVYIVEDLSGFESATAPPLLDEELDATTNHDVEESSSEVPSAPPLDDLEEPTHIRPQREIQAYAQQDLQEFANVVLI